MVTKAANTTVVKNGLLPTPPMAKGLPKANLTDNARQVLMKRYVRRGDDGKPAETAEEMFWRVAHHVAKVEAMWDADIQQRTIEYYHLLSSKKFFPNSPTFTGAGTPLGQLAACFVLPITDDMGRDSAGIFQTLRDAALIQQTGGGNGFSFSRLRPKGAMVQTSAGQATGPVGFLRVYDHAFGEIAQGGCLLPETLVFTNKGLLRLDEVVNTGLPGWQEHSLSVPTDEGVKDSPRGYNNGMADVLRVHTREGLSLTGTPNHKVKVMTEAGPQWKEIQDLAKGDWIIVRLDEQAGSLQVLKKPAKKHGNQVMPNLPSILDEELAFFLGYLAGDGFVAQDVDDQRVGVSVAHSSYLMEEMPAILTRLFNIKVHRMQKPNDRSVTYVMDNRAVKEFLLLNGLGKKSSREVSVPRLIRQSPPNIVGAYLRGLFEADGGLSHGYPSLGTSSPQLAREAATLLIGLGCPVRIRTTSAGLDRWGDSETHQVRITSTVGLQAWRENIGCDQRSRFVVAHAWESDLRRETSYVLPGAKYWLQPVLELITLEQFDKRGRGRNINFRATEPRLRKQILRYMRDDRNLTRSGYDLLKAEHPDAFENASPVDDFWFVEVDGVESAGQSLTLDLEVADNHTYLAYGMVTHNTRRGANMAVLRVDHPDVEDFIVCKINENQITNFNISVGITDAFMRAVKNDEEWELRFPDMKDAKQKGFGGTLEQAEAAGIRIISHGKVKARDLFNKIVRQAHHNGEPGVLFLDAANRSNPVPHLYPLEATNPCHRGTNLVHTDNGPVPIRDLVGCEFQVLTPDGTFAQATAYPTGTKPLFRVHLRNGYAIDLTENHNLILDNGSKRMVRDMKIGDKVKLSKHVVMPQMELASVAESSLHSTSSYDPDDSDMTDFAAVALVEDLQIIEDVYNLTVDHPLHQFAVNGIISANCGEQWLGPYENCCLGSVNLNKHCGPDGTVDWELLRQSVVLSTRFLDDVVEANAYVPAVPQLTEAAHRARRIGLGIMGLADLMYHVGVRYGSKEGQEFGAQVMEFVRYHAMVTSIELAKERGAFSAIEGSIYDQKNMKWAPPQTQIPFEHNWGRPEVRWDAVVEGIKTHGIRNAAQTTVAPTGTIATVAGCEGYGCEPVFALAYIRHVNDNGKDLKLTYASPRFDEALKKLGLGEEKRQEIVEQVMREGTCQHIKEIPQSVRDTFVVSGDISAEEHVRMQGALQAFVDNSLSKCVTWDTLVLTANGLMPISALSDMRLPDQFEANNITIVSPAGLERSDTFYYGGMRETRRVALAHGFEIEGTPNHRVQVLQADGRVDFKTLDDLKIGDEVLLYMGQQVFGPESQPLPAFAGAFRTDAKKIRFPSRMSVEFAYVLGCITSEGSIGENSIQICNGDRALLEDLGRLFEELFGLNCHIVQDMRRASVYSLQVNSRPLRNWLLNDLGLESGARNKIIPTCILRAGRTEIAAFLRGLFLDAYMTLDGRMFGIGLSNRRLLRQLQTLLLNFGVFSMIHRSAEHAWALNVSGESLDLLAAFVEFVEVWKNQRIAIRNDGRMHLRHNYATLLPESVTTNLREMQKNAPESLRSAFGELPRVYGVHEREYQRARVNLLQGHRLERALARRIYDHFKDYASPFAQQFFSTDQPGILYVKVQRVEAGFAEVFDISVPGSHSFIANGMGNHNTINFPETATEEDVATAYMLAWDLGCKGITVYVTGSRDKVVLETKATADKKDASTTAASTSATPPLSAVNKPELAPTFFHDPKKPRPKALTGKTYNVETPVGKAFVTINENGGEQPFEAFINTAKAGSETAAVSEAIGRLISYILRMTSPVKPTDRLREVVRQLTGIGGGRSLGFGPNRVRSLPDGIGQVLDNYLREKDGLQTDLDEKKANGNGGHTIEEEVAMQKMKIGDLCPECGEAAVVNEEGCRKCYACGFSEC